MEKTAESEPQGRGRPSKVLRLLEEYELDGLGLELEELWTAEENRRSLRDLATYFNQQLLKRALEEAGVQFLDGEVENSYRLLTEDDVSNAERTRVRRRLEREGIDVESLQDDFVTYQAIRTYLKDHRGAEYTTPEDDALERESTNVRKVRGRTVSVIEGKLERLQSGGHLTLGEFRTLVDIRVVCEDCNNQYDVLELFENEGCDCQESNE